MKARAKSEETRMLILDTALGLFRTQGFEKTTMREIASAAGVALGAAYYYYDSKDSMVLDFYERSRREMEQEVRSRLSRTVALEKRLRSVIEVKLQYFLPNRLLMGALSAHIDPEHSLSPFSSATKNIREQEIRLLAEAIEGSQQRITSDLKPFMPRVMWMYEMGILLFWVYDRSKRQRRTEMLFEKSLSIVAGLIKLSSFPLLKPVRKLIVDLLETVYGEGGEE
jgi:AcrR family transcriptional regulator